MWGDVSDISLNIILVNATIERAKRKNVPLATAAEHTLDAAQKDFGMPAERLPLLADLIAGATR